MFDWSKVSQLEIKRVLQALNLAQHGTPLGFTITKPSTIVVTFKRENITIVVNDQGMVESVKKETRYDSFIHELAKVEVDENLLYPYPEIR